MTTHVRFHDQPEQGRPLTAVELDSLARLLAESSDLAEAERLKSDITRGFYGAVSCH